MAASMGFPGPLGPLCPSHCVAESVEEGWGPQGLPDRPSQHSKAECGSIHAARLWMQGMTPSFPEHPQKQ